jgi:tetratricopeptide (TPR) repeat protein
MSATNSRNLETLLREGSWDAARKIIERELAKDPESHWLLTQLGVTYYEQGQYRESLQPLLSSLEIVPDCPLTLWNIAGALDMLGKPKVAIPIYTWLLRSRKSHADDPCWESEEWAEALQTDCVYRVGVCFQRMAQWQSAEHCFREYMNLLLAGRNGSYSVEDVATHIRELHRKGGRKLDKEARDAISSTLRDSGVQSLQAGRRKLPKLSLADLLSEPEAFLKP